MEETVSRSNFFFTLVKFFLFLIIFCFVVGLTRQFMLEVQGQSGLNPAALLASAFFAFFFYTFIADLGEVYKRAQMFFFRSPFISYLVPFILVVAAAAYFFMPRMLGYNMPKGLFVFCGGFIFYAHMIYVASQTKGTSFTDFINYLFILSILYIVNLSLLAVYLKLAFEFRLGKVLLDGLRVGVVMLRNFIS